MVGGGGTSMQPSGQPPPKKALLTAPQSPTETDPWAPEVTQTQISAKNENGIFGITAWRGFRKVPAVEKHFDHFQCSKKNFSARSAPEFIITD